jgi:oxygen-independent coproporphyrinogen-3 oxidase
VHDVAARDRPFEFCLNALRLREGFDAMQFEGRTGVPVTAIERPLALALERGLMASRPGGGWAPTPLGSRFLNDLQTLFLP